MNLGSIKIGMIFQWTRSWTTLAKMRSTSVLVKDLSIIFASWKTHELWMLRQNSWKRPPLALQKVWQSLQNFAKVLPSIPVASVRIEFRSKAWWINVDHQTNVSTLTQSTYMLYFLLASSFTTFEALSLLPSTNPILALLRAWFDSTKTLEGSFHGAPGPRNVFTDLRDITTGTSPCWDAISNEQLQNQDGIC